MATRPGMKAAERAFGDDQKFMARRSSRSSRPAWTRASCGRSPATPRCSTWSPRRIPLVEFVLRSTVARFDLDTAEGRSTALDRGVPLVAQIKDHGLRDEYARRLGGLVGIDDPLRVVHRVRGLVRSGNRPETPPADRPGREGGRDGRRASSARRSRSRCSCRPSPAPSSTRSRRARSCCLRTRALRAAIAAAGGTAAAVAGPAWTAVVEQHIDESLRSGVHALAVEPLRLGAVSEERYADAVLARMHANVTARQIVALKSKLQRINPDEQPEEHARLFAELIPLEMHRRLRERANGGP